MELEWNTHTPPDTPELRQWTGIFLYLHLMIYNALDNKQMIKIVEISIRTMEITIGVCYDVTLC